MYSQKGDTVLDPFMGLGTTVIASILSERNSIGYEIDSLLKPLLKEILNTIDVLKANSLIRDRYTKHLAFVEDRIRQGKDVKYVNNHLQCKVMTKQETDLTFHYLKNIILNNEVGELEFESNYYVKRELSDFPMNKRGSLFEFAI